MTPRLPASSRKCRETRPARAALLKRPSGRSPLLRNDPSTISSPAATAADPDKPGRPRSDRQPHNHSPPALTSPPVQISDTVASCHSATLLGELPVRSLLLLVVRRDGRLDPALLLPARQPSSKGGCGGDTGIWGHG